MLLVLPGLLVQRVLPEQLVVQDHLVLLVLVVAHREIPAHKELLVLVVVRKVIPVQLDQLVLPAQPVLLGLPVLMV